MGLKRDQGDPLNAYKLEISPTHQGSLDCSWADGVLNTWPSSADTQHALKDSDIVHLDSACLIHLVKKAS